MPLRDFRFQFVIGSLASHLHVNVASGSAALSGHRHRSLGSETSESERKCGLLFADCPRHAHGYVFLHGFNFLWVFERFLHVAQHRAHLRFVSDGGGMNLGWFTALAAAHGLQVVAVEPSATKVQRLGHTNSKKSPKELLRFLSCWPSMMLACACN